MSLHEAESQRSLVDGWICRETISCDYHARSVEATIALKESIDSIQQGM